MVSDKIFASKDFMRRRRVKKTSGRKAYVPTRSHCFPRLGQARRHKRSQVSSGVALQRTAETLKRKQNEVYSSVIFVRDELRGEKMPRTL